MISLIENADYKRNSEYILALDDNFERYSESYQNYIKQQYLNERTSDKLSNATKVTLLGLAAVTAFLGKKVSKIIRNNYSECARKCKPYSPDKAKSPTNQDYRKYKVCKFQCKVDGYNDILSKLNNVDCSKQNNPDKCKEKISKTKEKLSKKINKYQEKIRDYKRGDD